MMRKFKEEAYHVQDISLIGIITSICLCRCVITIANWCNTRWHYVVIYSYSKLYSSCGDN